MRAHPTTFRGGRAGRWPAPGSGNPPRSAMSCCGPSRRTVLGALGLAVLLPAGIASGNHATAQSGPIAATDLEVVTVTDTSAVLTWTSRSPDRSGRLVPVDTDGEVLLAAAGAAGPLRPVWGSDGATAFHYAEFGGLEPGRTYRFEARSAGIRAAPAISAATGLPGTPETTGTFRTLVPPPGRLLRTLALANDIHYGETVSGLLVGEVPPGFRQEPGLPPYPQVMLDALLDDLRRADRGATTLLIAGDLTAEATPEEMRSVRAQLDRWGNAGSEYLAVRGNHDRPHTGAGYAGCAVVPGTAHHDCWAEVFGPRQQLVEHELGGLRLLGLDTSALDGAGGVLDPPQFDRMRELLTGEPDRPTIVFGHHPVTTEAGLTNVGGPGFILDRPNALRLQQLYDTAPGVFLQHSGHTHRTRRTRPDTGCAVEFLEIAAVKEYPGGYGLLRIYEGGYTMNFYKTRTPAARRWSTLTRGEYFGLYPDYTLGTFADRNHVVLRDFSGLS